MQRKIFTNEMFIGEKRENPFPKRKSKQVIRISYMYKCKGCIICKPVKVDTNNHPCALFIEKEELIVFRERIRQDIFDVFLLITFRNRILRKTSPFKKGDNLPDYFGY